MSAEQEKKDEAQNPLEAVRRELQRVLEKISTENPEPEDKETKDELKSKQPS